MNGRVFTVNRSPVLAWNVEVPYPDMPAAAAAAISPIVPTASDPYNRCWQNQVDQGSSYPYFGTLYNNSLPPTAYRLQPGCMPNIGQFWPPTPPPDGCGRFDGNNLYFGPPVLRHGENLTSNMRNSFQGLSHYSHLAETSKEVSQRVFKQEKAQSPNVSSCPSVMCSLGSKSDNLSSCCVESKSRTQCSVSRSLPKQESITVSSGHEPYYFAPDIRSSSTNHPSTDKICFSSAYSLKGNLNIHSPPQESVHKMKSIPLSQENNCNSSPYKNVYFSHYESENINSLQCKNFEKISDEQFYSDHKQLSLNSNKSRNLHQPLSDYYLSNPFSKNYDFLTNHELHKSVTSHRASDNSLKEQHKQKSYSSRIKSEKTNPYDCKYQRNNPRCSTFVQNSENKTPEVSNSTSVMHPKLEPKDKLLMSSCSSSSPSCMAPSYVTSSSPYLLSNSTSKPSICSFQKNIYRNPSPLSKPWSYDEMPLIASDSYFKSPEAAKPPVQNQMHVSSVLHEDLISIAQTAPPDMQIAKDVLSQRHASHQKVDFEVDDEIQIIGVQNKSTSSKQASKIAGSSVDFHHSSSIFASQCLKDKSREVNSPGKISTSEDQINTVPPALEAIDFSIDINSSIKSNSCDDKLNDNNLVKYESHLEPPCLTASEIKPLDIVIPDVKKEADEVVDSMNHVSSINMNSVADKVVPVNKQTVQSREKLDKNNFNSGLELKEDIKKESLCEFNENHGLNLLLDTIEKVTSQEILELPKLNIAAPLVDSIVSNDLKEINSHTSTVSKNRGLELLLSIAEERLVSEFDVIKTEPKDSPVCSNHPQIKEEPKLGFEDGPLKQNIDYMEKPVSTVFEMHGKLVELQKKYKQKQKELSRLKPKKRFTDIYLKCCSKTEVDNSDQITFSNTSSCSTNSNLSASLTSSTCTDQLYPKSEPINDSPSEMETKVENESDHKKKKPKRSQQTIPFKKESSVEILSEEEIQKICVRRRLTRRSKPTNRKCSKLLKSSLERKRLSSISFHSKSIKHHQGKRYSRYVKKSKLSLDTYSDTSKKSLSSVNKRSFQEKLKKSKAYSLRQSSFSASKRSDSGNNSLSENSKIIGSKRKSVNPKRYVPSKQGKMSETIIAKHLRNRILFDTSGSVSDEEIAKDCIQDNLCDPMINFQLIGERKAHNFTDDDEDSEMSYENSLGHPEPSLLKAENLIERHRLLAFEDGLFYAGHIKECCSSNRYGIALDGQRGNKLHTFTREELLTQTIVESKPVTPHLPEGTRVCAYWSQQYRCLYPGVIGKASCPSADWSEPRVFVQFDDGDSGQIPTKNVRLIPPNVIPWVADLRLDSLTSYSHSVTKSKDSSCGQMPRRLRSSTPKKRQKGISNENESKDSSCTSINDSSCDDSCFMDYFMSPSQSVETIDTSESILTVNNSTEYSKSEKKQRKHSKKKLASRLKSREVEYSDDKGKNESKTKRHKKYKEKHRRHHHHHHRHHHHHHHHHHSKKRKHRRKTGKSPTSQDLDYENCIPCKSNLKNHKTFEVVSTNLTEHSNAIHLPQDDKD